MKKLFLLHLSSSPTKFIRIQNPNKSQLLLIENNILFKILMKRELKKQELAKLYREFSRQKYNKYRHQFPRMRESQLVSKIIKEWQALSFPQKQQLYQIYIAEKHISDDKSESSEKRESPGSSKQKKKKSQNKSVSKGPKLESTPTPQRGSVKVYVYSSSSKKDKDQESISSDYAREGAKKDFEISSSVEKELGVPIGKKKKIIKKEAREPRTEYLKFFKFYYDKLTVEHPRWSSNQISTIIKLLWKKKSLGQKKASKTGLVAPREKKSISGRMAFRKAHSYSGIQAYERWKQLTRESKKYWSSKGLGRKSGERKGMPSNINFRKRKLSESSNQTRSVKSLGFMNKTMS